VLRYSPRTKPFPHQVRGSIALARRKNYALFFEPRLGKTKTALDAVGMLYMAGRIRRVLVMGPLRSLDVWEQQIRKHYPFQVQCEDYESEWTLNPTRSTGPTSHGTEIFFLNYEKARYRVRTRRGWAYPYLKEVERWDPDLIILDESHRLKRAGGVTAQGTWRMVRRLRKRRGHVGGPPYVCLLTGTPNPKGWIDLFAQFRIIDEEIFGTDKASFEEDHVTYGRGPMKYSVVKYRNVPTILEKVHAHSLTVTAEEAGLAGEQFWQDLHVTLPAKARKAYDEMAEEFIAEIEGTVVSAANPAVKRLRLLQITGGYTTDGVEIHREKVKSLSDYAADLWAQDEHVLVYCRYLPEVDACADALEALGYPTTDLHGGTGRRTFSDAVARFQRAKSPHALVFQVQTGSLSIELSAAAEVVIYSPPDGWENYFQCLQRVMGPNQKRPVRYTHILARHTMDGPVMASLAAKEDYHATLLKNPRRFLYGYSDDGDYDDVIQ